jgi:esterase/lipase
MIFMSEQKLIIPSKSGERLNAILYKSSVEQKMKPPLLIMCHGFTGDKFEHGIFPNTAKAASIENIDSLIFDFSGSGENRRVPVRLLQQIDDLESVYHWTGTQGYNKIAVLGLSFGGLTLLGAELPRIESYIFWAPVIFLHTTEERTSYFKDLDKGPVEVPSDGIGGPIIIEMSFMTDFAKIRVKKHLKKINSPVLMVQGTADEEVPLEFTRKAFNQLSPYLNKKLVEVQDAGHNFSGEYEKFFIESTISWLKNLFN